MADAIRARLSASFGLPSQREWGRASARAHVRADGHVGDGHSDLDSIDLVTEVASHPSDDSLELSSVPSDAESETPELTEAGDVAVLDVAEGERLPLPRKADSNETIKPKTSPEGSLPIVPAPPRPMAQTGTSLPEDTADGAQPAPARPARASLLQGPGWTSKPRLIARLFALAALAQPLLTLGAASPSGSSGSDSSTGHSGFASPATDLSPYAERPGPFVPAPGMPPRLPSALAAAAVMLAHVKQMREKSGAMEVGAANLRPPPEDVLQEPAHRISVPVPLSGGMCSSHPSAATR
jgi:hypothetical protein